MNVPMTHASLQQAITELCDWLGIWWWHDTDSRKNKRGLPDLYFVGGPADYEEHNAMWREIKVPPDDLRPEQAALIERMKIAGVDADVWRPEDWRSGRIRAELESINRGAVRRVAR